MPNSEQKEMLFISSAEAMLASEYRCELWRVAQRAAMQVVWNGDLLSII